MATGIPLVPGGLDLGGAPVAPLSILFNAGQFAIGLANPLKRVKLDTLEVACTLSESLDYDADVTEFEVEQGAKISDHRRTSPATYTISGLVSDTPLPSDTIAQAVAAAAPALGLALSAGQTAIGLTNDALFTRAAFAKLEELFEVGRRTDDGSEGTFSIVTKFRTFENMVCKSLKIARSSGDGLALPFSATFRELRFVSTKVGTFTLPALQAANPQGAQGGDAASDAVAQKAHDSIAFQGLDSKPVFNGDLGRAADKVHNIANQIGANPGAGSNSGSQTGGSF